MAVASRQRSKPGELLLQPVRRLASGILRVLLPTLVLAVILLLVGLGRFGSLGGTLAFLQGYALWASPSSCDLGTISRDTPSYALFTLRNLTSRPVTILGAQTDCCCWVSSDLPTTVLPGEEQTLQVQVYPRGLASGKRFEQRLELFLDVAGPRPVLRVTGELAKGRSLSSSPSSGNKTGNETPQ